MPYMPAGITGMSVSDYYYNDDDDGDNNNGDGDDDDDVICSKKRQLQTPHLLQYICLQIWHLHA